jgi:hypothetical protein
MMSFSCAHLPFSTKAVAPEKLQGEAELPLFFWGTGRLVTGPISHKQQFFFFFFLAFWSKQCDQSLFHLLGFLPSYSRRCFFGGSLRAVGIKHVCGDENLQYPAEMYSVIHRAKGKEGMDGRRARNGGRKSCTDIFTKSCYSFSTSCESRPPYAIHFARGLSAFLSTILELDVPC